MPDVTIAWSDHVCRLATSIIGAVIISICSVILFFQACRWINQALDNRQYRLETDRRERIERARQNIIAEREGWRRHDEYLVEALAGYAKENQQYKEFLKTTKVTDVFTKWKEEKECTQE